MAQKTYRIGDVANLMGLSRDTLRYYEKRGILSSKKEENGYRYYTEEDIYRLFSILYQRKMDIGLDDLEQIWSQDLSVSSLSQIMKNRMEEEKMAIRRHQQTMARLNLTSEDCENIKNHMDQVILKNSPRSHIIVPHAGFSESLALWFQYAQKYPGLDMMYIFDEYNWDPEKEDLGITYKNSQLVLHADLAEYVDYDLSPESHPIMQPSLCMTRIRISQQRIPTAEDLLPMLQWAKEQDLMVSRQFYCTFMLQGLSEGCQSCYIQLYVPVF